MLGKKGVEITSVACEIQKKLSTKSMTPRIICPDGMRKSQKSQVFVPFGGGGG